MSLVRPILEYAATVWSPHLQYKKNRIKKVQRSAACFVTNDFHYCSSVSNMLAQLQWPLLQQQRNFLKLIVFHKILHGSVSVLFTLVLLTTSTRGHSSVLLFLLPELTLINILSYPLSYNTVVLYSRDRYEIIGLHKNSHSIKKTCSSICLKKAFAIHQSC